MKQSRLSAALFRVAIPILIVVIIILCGILLHDDLWHDISTEKRIEPNLTRYGTGYYYYLVDNNTGVVYLEYANYQAHAITVLLNPDGTPVTKDQLGLN